MGEGTPKLRVFLDLETHATRDSKITLKLNVFECLSKATKFRHI
jgi:hypothetical protein